MSELDKYKSSKTAQSLTKRVAAAKPPAALAGMGIAVQSNPNVITNGKDTGREDTSLFDILGMADRYADHASDTFTMSYQPGVDRNSALGRKIPAADQTAQLTQMTVASAVTWLRDLASNDPDSYNQYVAKLYASGYLSKADAKLGRFTSKVGQAFAYAAFDVAATNQGGDLKTSLVDHLDALADANPDIADGGSKRAPYADPTRVDEFTNPDDVKAAARAAAKSALGRNLNDAELEKFVSHFHAQEATYNNQKYSAQVANAKDNYATAGGTAQTSSHTVTDAPSVTAEATENIQNDPRLRQEKAGQDAGSYLAILSQMMGQSNMAGGNDLN